MRTITSLFVAVLLAVPAVVTAETYQWRDDNGVTHFSDNPDRVPARYLNRVKEHSSVSSESKGKSPANSAAPQPAATASVPSPGDRPGGTRQAVNESLRRELKTLDERLPAKREELRQLHHKWVVRKGRNPSKDEQKEFKKKQAKGEVKAEDNPYVNRNSLGSPGASREAYYKKLDEIQKDVERIARLRREIDALEREAGRVGEPLELRK
jgi:hypothetical protein